MNNDEYVCWLETECATAKKIAAVLLQDRDALAARLAEAERRAEIFARYCNPGEMLPDHADLWADSLKVQRTADSAAERESAT